MRRLSHVATKMTHYFGWDAAGTARGENELGHRATTSGQLGRVGRSHTGE
jgi:hypothetical protein